MSRQAQAEREKQARVILGSARRRSHGRHGVSAILLGSETVKVLTHCKIPVLVYR